GGGVRRILADPQAGNSSFSAKRLEESTGKPRCATIIARRSGDHRRLKVEKGFRRLLHQRDGFQALRCLDRNAGRSFSRASGQERRELQRQGPHLRIPRRRVDGLSIDFQYSGLRGEIELGRNAIRLDGEISVSESGVAV